MLAPLVDAWRRSPTRRRFDALAPRERMLLWTCLGALSAALLYGLATSLFAYRSDSVARFAKERGDLEWMQLNRGAASAAFRAGAGAPAQRTEMPTINAAAREFELPLRRIQPEANGISVQIEGQPFEKVVRWTSSLELRHGVEILNARIDRYEAGIVNARFTFR